MNRGKRLVNLVVNQHNEDPPNNPNKENQLNAMNISNQTSEPIELIVLNEDTCHIEKVSNFDRSQILQNVLDTSILIQPEDLFSSSTSKEIFEDNSRLDSNFELPQTQEHLPIRYNSPFEEFYPDLIPFATDMNATKTADECTYLSTTPASLVTASANFDKALEITNISERLLPEPILNPDQTTASSLSTVTATSPEPIPETSYITMNAEIEPTYNQDLILTASIPNLTIDSETSPRTSNVSLRVEPEANCTISDPNNHNINEGRKRRKTAEPNNWKRNLNKRLRMQGKSYTGFRIDNTKKIHQDTARNNREIKPTCTKDICKRSKTKKCSIFTQEQRTEIFERFWNLSWNEKKAFVCGHATKIEKQKSTVLGRESRRNFTIKYRLSNGRFEESVEVCREMFINTLGIGYRSVQLWVKKGSFEMPGPSTSRSSLRPNRNSIKVNGLRNFLTLLPKMPSHYNRQHSSKLYLEPIFQTIQDVYQLYCSRCKDEDTETVSRRKFKEVMESENISLFQLKKDQCNICKSYESKNISDEKWNEHVRKKQIARKYKQEDKEKALAGLQNVIEVDFQAVKLAPFTNANAFYYKTKLACHNYTCYNLKTKEATCYWFSEDQNNQLVASSFVSCLIDYLEKKCITPDKKDIIVYSDGCTAQNRNNIMSNALLNLSILHGINIYQKYLEVGHTQMEVDSVHGCIERKLKGREIKLPSDYVNVTKEARKNPCPYEALQLEYDFFKDYTHPLLYKSIRPGRGKNDPTVMDIKVIAYTPDGIIKVKIDFDGDYLILPSRPARLDPVQAYPPLYTERCKINKSKWLHLQELKSVIPHDCHEFYDNLPYKE